jgi:hypothetical protein
VPADLYPGRSDVRLGAISALSAVANESPNDRGDNLEIVVLLAHKAL